MPSRKADAEALALADSHLPEEEFAALVRLLRWASSFVLVFVRSNVPVESRRIVAKLSERLSGDGLSVRDLSLRAATDDLLAEIRAITPPPATNEVVMVLGFEHSIPSRISHPPALDRLNRSRESFRELLCPLVLVLPDYALNQLAREAPDFWAWRSGVFATRPAVSRPSIDSEELRSATDFELFSLSRERKEGHLEALQELLAKLERSEGGNEPEKTNLCLRISVLHQSLGELNVALLYARKALEHAGEDVHGRVSALGQIANIHDSRGELDEALRIRQEEMLPVHERLGDVKSRAITLGSIADIYVAQGQLDKALRIRQEVSLPIYEELGDVRSRAITLGKIADIYQARGGFGEALRIHQEEELPVYEKIGDVRSRAIALRKIATIYHAQGELDVALRICQEELLPSFEKLGDRRERARTLGKVADIYHDQGELDEAIRIRQEELLPVFEELGDERSRAQTLGRIADIYRDRGELAEAVRIHQEEELPILERIGDRQAIAQVLFRIAQIELQRQEIRSAIGRMEEAYRILLRLGALDGIAVVGRDLARMHLDSGLTEEARVLLLRSREGFAKLGWAVELEETEALLKLLGNSKRSVPRNHNRT